MSKKKYRIVTVCGAGVGTSNFLKANVEEVLSDLNIDGYVENVSLSMVKSTTPDLVLTFPTLSNLVDELDVDVIIINNLFNREEIEEKLSDYFLTNQS